jgi:hypothetical protein
MQRGGSLWIAFTLLGCAEVVIDPDEATGGNASVSTSSSGASASVVAGSTSAGFAVTSSSSISSGGQGGEFGGCAVVLDEEPYHVTHFGPNEQIYENGCGDPQPTARVQLGGKCSPGTHISACKPGGPPDLDYFFDASTPLISLGEGPMSGSNNFVMLTTVEVTITHFGEVGGSIIGHYEGSAVDEDGVSQPVSGSFKLCRAPDVPPCP